jgi:hypothetical protein
MLMYRAVAIRAHFLLFACFASVWVGAAAFTAGNVAVYRVGSGTGLLVNTGNPVFIDEYTPSGALVQSIALPTAASGLNFPLIASGTAASEGGITRSVDEQCLWMMGYGVAPGGSSVSGTTSALVPRVAGRINTSGTTGVGFAAFGTTSGRALSSTVTNI